MEGWARPEYSYGPMVPFITLYLALHEIHERPLLEDRGSRLWGYVAFGLAVAVGLLGNLVQIHDVVAYGFILFVGSMILLVAGTQQGARLWPGWVHLIFMLPLPQFLYLNVSTQLQLLSSQIGVEFIQLAGVPVFLDGNIIDLGIYQLQVAEACSGLRYLFPLFSFGWLIATLYNGPAWHRVVLFLSTIPITILMNSFRIGVIGVMVNAYGISAAEGFLHAFEGWIIFIACTVILCAEAWVLWRLFTPASQRRGPMLSLDFPPGFLSPLGQLLELRTSRAIVIIATLMLAIGLAWQLQPPRQTTTILTRAPLTVFPMQFGGWNGAAVPLDENVKRVLAADDYVAANYNTTQGEVGLLLTFYGAQTQSNALHSPEVCLPGSGWEVSRWTQMAVDTGMGAPVRVNRAIIQNGTDRQLVYYWFEGRGRHTANDYETKFIAIVDTLLAGRSDGGLVRLTTPIRLGEDPAAADDRLAAFLRELTPLLPSYYPSI